MKSTKLLLNQKWAENFFSQRADKYFPNQRLVECQPEAIKVYLNFKRVIVKYHLRFSDKNNNFSEVDIVGKAEKISPFELKNSEIFCDYKATKFLQKKGLADIVPKPIDYLAAFNLYLYEYVPGYFLQELSVKHQAEKFLELIPPLAKTIARIHRLKISKSDKITKKTEKFEEREMKRHLKLTKQYCPTILNDASRWAKTCFFIKEKYRKYFNPENFSVTHGDFYSRNILIANGYLKLIDFSHSAIYDPLNDIGNFLINTELMFEYDFPKIFSKLMKELKESFFKNYFSSPFSLPSPIFSRRSFPLHKKVEGEDKNGKEISVIDEFKINYFILTNLIRITAFASISEGKLRTGNQLDPVMEKLLRFGKEKNKNLQNLL